MKEQFVTYEIALKLKELGFDEDCFGYYTPMKNWMISTNPKYNTDPHFIGPNWANNDNTMRFMYVPNIFGDRDSTVKNSKFTKAIYNIAVPLWQQVIDWFREKHKIDIYPEPTYSLTEYSFKVITVHGKSKKQEYWDGMGKTYNTYQEAREQAILKVIEILELPKN